MPDGARRPGVSIDPVPAWPVLNEDVQATSRTLMRIPLLAAGVSGVSARAASGVTAAGTTDADAEVPARPTVPRTAWRVFPPTPESDDPRWIPKYTPHTGFES